MFTRLALGWGKIRRFYLIRLNKEYVRGNLARRQGECARCGACCTLMFHCPWLRGEDGMHECVRHSTRAGNCSAFPIDERDLQDREAIANGRKCGYRFTGINRNPRWFTLALLLGAMLSSAATGAEPCQWRASFRGGRPPAGWFASEGRWETTRRGLKSLTPGAIRCAEIDLSGSGAAVDVWAATDGGDLTVSFAGVTAGVEAGKTLFATHGSETGRRRLSRPLERRPFRISVRWQAGAIQVEADGESLRYQPTFIIDNAEPKSFGILVGPGVTVEAVTVRKFDCEPRAEALVRGDGEWLAGNADAAAALYAKAALERSPLPASRAEVAWKLGMSFMYSGEMAEAAEALKLARSFDSGGQWGERARMAYARAALADGQPELALRFAHEAVTSAREIVDWAEFLRVLGEASDALQAAGHGPRATHQLVRIAKHVEWTAASRPRAREAWELAALSYEARGWRNEADEIRLRAERRFGPIPLP